MPGAPTLNDVMEALRDIHGDVKVALDRTTSQQQSIDQLQQHVRGHCIEIAQAKGKAAMLGGVAAGIITAAFQLLKMALTGRPT